MFGKSKDQKRLEQLRTWVAEQRQTRDSWQILGFNGTKWICPLCGEIAAVFSKPQELDALVQVHIIENCPAHRSGKTDPAFSADRLNARMRLFQSKNSLLRNPAWQIRDSQGNWFCPYCTKPTNVVISRDGKITEAIVAEIQSHLESCYLYAHGEGEQKLAEAIKKSVQATELERRLVSEVKANISAKPAWRVKSAKGFWVCPYCRRILQSINASTDLILQNSAPFAIAKHFISDCQSYKSRATPAVTVEELQAVLDKEEPVKKPEPQNQPGSEAMDAMQAQIEAVKATMKADKGLREEVQTARKKQLRMLPKAPIIEGFEFQAAYRPCAELGGDFYDFIDVGPNRIGLLIGDVSGHGVEAGLVMALVKKVLNMAAKSVKSPKEALVFANTEVYPDLDRNTFVTVCYALLDTQAGTLQFVRAGHNPPVLFNAARTPPIQIFSPSGMAFAMDSGQRFNPSLEQAELALQPGDQLVFYTDGVPETDNEAGAEFGIEGLVDAVKKYGGHEAKYLMHMLLMELDEFRGEKPQADDITVVCVKVAAGSGA